MTTVVVFGGTGFLGRRLVQRLVADGARVRVAVRHPEAARSALGAAGLEAVTVLRADVRDRASVAAAIAGADAAVNAVSAYVETAGVTFEAVHVHGAETAAREAAAAVGRFVLVSGTTPYLRQMSMAALRVVPAPSMKVSGRLTNASVSFEAIQVKRGDSSSVLVSFPAATRW